MSTLSMKKLLMIGMLASASLASAATWEYASFEVWDARSDKNYFWNTPDMTGPAKFTQGKTVTEISTGSGCNAKPLGQHILNERDLFQCFGAAGWELVSIEVQNLSVMTAKTYWFKRAGK